MSRLGARHEVVAITVDDPREHDLPESGWIEMHGCGVGSPGAGGHREPRGAAPGGPARGASREERARALAAAGADHVHLETGSRLCHSSSARLCPAGPTDPSQMIDPRRSPPAAAGGASHSRRHDLAAVGGGATGYVVRASDWDPADPGRAARPAARRHDRRLRRDQLSRRDLATGAPNQVELPGPLLLGPGGKVDSLPGQTVRITVRSVLPPGCLIR